MTAEVLQIQAEYKNGLILSEKKSLQGAFVKYEGHPEDNAAGYRNFRREVGAAFEISNAAEEVTNYRFEIYSGGSWVVINNGVTLEDVLKAAKATKSVQVRITPRVSGPSATIEGFVLTSTVVVVGAVAAYYYLKNKN